MKLLPIRCPDCNGRLEVAEDRQWAHCPYCRSQVALDWEGQRRDGHQMELAFVEMEAGHWVEADQRFQRVLERNPRQREAWFWRAICALLSPGVLDVVGADRYLAQSAVTEPAIVHRLATLARGNSTVTGALYGSNVPSIWAQRFLNALQEAEGDSDEALFKLAGMAFKHGFNDTAWNLIVDGEGKLRLREVSPGTIGLLGGIINKALPEPRRGAARQEGGTANDLWLQRLKQALPLVAQAIAETHSREELTFQEQNLKSDRWFGYSFQHFGAERFFDQIEWLWRHPQAALALLDQVRCSMREPLSTSCKYVLVAGYCKLLRSQVNDATFPQQVQQRIDGVRRSTVPVVPRSDGATIQSSVSTLGVSITPNSGVQTSRPMPWILSASALSLAVVLWAWAHTHNEASSRGASRPADPVVPQTEAQPVVAPIATAPAAVVSPSPADRLRRGDSRRRHHVRDSEQTEMERAIDEGVVDRHNHPPAAAPATAPTGGGDLPLRPSQTDVLMAMREVAPAVRACGDGSGGRVTVTITFAGSGRVVASNANGEHADDAIGSCAAQRVRSAHIPPFGSPTFNVTYPFGLE